MRVISLVCVLAVLVCMSSVGVDGWTFVIYNQTGMVDGNGNNIPVCNNASAPIWKSGTFPAATSDELPTACLNIDNNSFLLACGVEGNYPFAFRAFPGNDCNTNNTALWDVSGPAFNDSQCFDSHGATNSSQYVWIAPNINVAVRVNCSASAPTAAPPASPTTASPTTPSPTTASPTTANPTTAGPTTASPTTKAPTGNTTASPTTPAPAGNATTSPTTQAPAGNATKAPTSPPKSEATIVSAMTAGVVALMAVVINMLI